MLAIRLTFVGQVTVRPEDGLTVGVSVTVPAKLSKLEIVIDSDAPDTAELKFLTGLMEEIAKSPTWTKTVVEFATGTVPLAPLPVIVRE